MVSLVLLNAVASFQVFLHVEDSWAETAGQSYLLVKRPRWRWKRGSNRVLVMEVSGTNR